MLIMGLWILYTSDLIFFVEVDFITIDYDSDTHYSRYTIYGWEHVKPENSHNNRFEKKSEDQ